MSYNSNSTSSDSDQIKKKTIKQKLTEPTEKTSTLTMDKTATKKNTFDNGKNSDSNKNDNDNGHESSIIHLKVSGKIQEFRKARFCQCDATGVGFGEVRELILIKQCRICPGCKTKWKNIILIEKTMTVCDLICSFQGVGIILFVILQFAILYYIAFLAFLDVQFAAERNTYVIERSVLLYLTWMFLIVSTWNMGWYVYRYAEVAIERSSDKIITDVILDLTCRL